MENWQGSQQEQLSRASGGARVRATRYERTMAARTLWHGSVRGRAAVRARARAPGNMTGKHMMEGWRESPPHMHVGGQVEGEQQRHSSARAARQRVHSGDAARRDGGARGGHDGDLEVVAASAATAAAQPGARSGGSARDEQRDARDSDARRAAWRREGDAAATTTAAAAERGEEQRSNRQQRRPA